MSHRRFLDEGQDPTLNSTGEQRFKTSSNSDVSKAESKLCTRLADSYLGCVGVTSEKAGPSPPQQTTTSPLRIRYLPSYQGSLLKKSSHSSFASTVRSIPLTPSDSGNEADEGYDPILGERDRVRELEDLRNWAFVKPGDTVKEEKSCHSHLPDWSSLHTPFTLEENRSRPVAGRVDSGIAAQSKYSEQMAPSETVEAPELELLTAYPRSTTIQPGLETEMLSILDLEHFEKILSQPAMRSIFRDWLQGNLSEVSTGQSTETPLSKMDQLTDESLINELSRKLRDRAEEPSHTYQDCDSQHSTLGSARSKKINKAAIHDATQLWASNEILTPSHKWLSDSLYEETFKQFVTQKLVSVTKIKLQNNLDEKTYSGLGDCFCLTNPRFSDNPIVIVSPGFAATTGYESNSIIGRNCRFLQGPGTNPKSIEHLRLALRTGCPCVELLLNYRSDGTPFYCLLSILPLFDEKGSLTYFIGGQVNVTNELANNDLALLIDQDGFGESKGSYIEPTDFASSSYVARTASEQPSEKPVISPAMRKSATTTSKVNAPKSSSMKWLTSKIKRDTTTSGTNFQDFSARSGPKLDNLEDSITAFQSGYSRIILFKRKSRNIVYVTPEALEYLGLPITTLSETYSSSLLHTDFMDLVRAEGINSSTRSLKSSLKKAIAGNKAASFPCNLSFSYSLKETTTTIPYWNKKSQINKSSFVHLTPLIDATGNCTSYVAILS